MQNLRVFDTLEEFIEAQGGTGSTGESVTDIVPGFAYIREETPGTRYNPIPEPEPTPEPKPEPESEPE